MKILAHELKVHIFNSGSKEKKKSSKKLMHAFNNIYLFLCIVFYRYRFPSILLVYFLVTPIIFDVTYLIGLAGRDALYCRSSDLLETIEKSTPFCYFTGKHNYT